LQLLIAIRDMFEDQNTDRIMSKSLVARLIEDQTGPWVAFGKNQKPISENAVARLLKQYGISPRTVRTTDDRAKGYHLAWFKDAFERHLSPAAEKNLSPTVTPCQFSELNDLEQEQTVTSDLFVTDGNEPNRWKTNACHGVTVADAGFRGGAADQRCDHCGQLGATGRWDWLGRPDGIWLHPRCEEAWFDSEGPLSR
jgi:uncharacterized protein DUF3631